jgi:hypothetical protein
MDFFKDVFQDRVINSSLQPAHSPQLQSIRLFFMGTIKQKVYSSTPNTVEDIVKISKEKFFSLSEEEWASFPASSVFWVGFIYYTGS